MVKSGEVGKGSEDGRHGRKSTCFMQHANKRVHAEDKHVARDKRPKFMVSGLER